MNSRWDKEWIIQKSLTLPPSQPRLFWRSAVQFVPEVLRKHIRLPKRDHIGRWNSKEMPTWLHCPSHPRKQCIFFIFLWYSFVLLPLLFILTQCLSCQMLSSLWCLCCWVPLKLLEAWCILQQACSLEFCYRVSIFLVFQRPFSPAVV